MEIWFGIAYVQSSSIFGRVICPPHDRDGVFIVHVFFFFLLYYDQQLLTLSKDSVAQAYNIKYKFCN